MNITLENKGNLEAIIKVSLKADDYQPNVEKSLKDYQKKANVPGFRQGKVPAGVVKKMYGKALLADEINKASSDALFKYLEENNIEILGYPIPNMEKTTGIDWDNQVDFDFYYDLGLAPNIDFDIKKQKEVLYYNIKPTEEIIDKSVLELRQRYGKFTNPETSEDKDLIYGEFAEIDENKEEIENGIKHFSSVSLDLIKDEATKAKLIGIKKEDVVFINPKNISNGNATDMAAMLNVSKDIAENIDKDFKFSVKAVSRVEPAELNTELYEKVYKEDKIETEAQLRDKISNEIVQAYSQESDRMFLNDAVTVIVENTNVEIPEDFLKRWLLHNNEGKLSKEDIENEFGLYKKSLMWQLLETKILKEHDIKVTTDEVKSYIKGLVSNQFKMYGQEGTEDMFDKVVDNVMKNEKEAKKYYDKLYDEKLTEFFKNNLKLNKKEVTFDEFIKIVTDKK